MFAENTFLSDIRQHGGDLVSASAHYRIDMDQWIDLSTGVNPEAYPVAIQQSSFQRLPYILPEFTEASTEYYGNRFFVPVAGTQVAIERLPEILTPLPVLVPEVGYQEHAWCWKRSGVDVRYYPSMDKEIATAFIKRALIENNQQHVVIVHPNNPTGLLFDKHHLRSWAATLASGACLIVDEAFIDVTPEDSLLDQPLPENMIVLRSFGKFFGLAGIRLGYCFAHPSILALLQQKLGLWQVNGPAQAVATQALRDRVWQQTTLARIKIHSAWMTKVCQPLMHIVSEEVFDSYLFTSWLMPCQRAVAVQEYFAQAGILLRIIELSDNKSLVRIGLADSEDPVIVDRVVHQFESACEYFSHH